MYSFILKIKINYINYGKKNDCTELASTSPLGLIIPAQSKGTFPIVFESDYVQTFQRYFLVYIQLNTY